MANYRFTESQDAKGNPVGTLEKQVTEGGQTSWQEDMKGHIPYDREAEKDKEHDLAIADINSKIPEEASGENKLTDHNQVSGDIATASATFRNTYNLVSDLSLTTSATREQVAAALGTVISVADNNDFCYVEVPTADATPTEIARTNRYKFNGTTWGYEFSIPGFTAAEWAAIHSGITSLLVTEFGNKYKLPSVGIPKTDLASDVQASLGKADTALQQHQDISGMINVEDAENLSVIMALCSYPNANVTVTTNAEWKCVWTDANDAILFGKKQDDTWWFSEDLDDILDDIIAGFTPST